MRLAYRTVVRKRAELLFYAFIAAYALIALRLTYVQFWKAERYEIFGNRIRGRERQLEAQRGVIYDRIGRELAINVKAASVYANPNRVREAGALATQLASLLDCDRSLLLSKLSDDDRGFVWLRRCVEERTGAELRKAKIAGIGVLDEYKRVYPSEGVAAQVIGFTNIDGEGLEGVERVADSYLRGADGLLVADVDPNGRVIPETRRRMVEPRDGRDVVLTIDRYIQHVAEEELRATFEENKANGASAIVLDPKTGEVLALANMPSFNPNNRAGSGPECWRNRAITDLYEPGSTLKTITAAAALEEGLITPNQVFANCAGTVTIGRRRVRCSLHAPFNDGHGEVDLTKLLTYSCNIAASRLGLDIGPERLYKYEKAFGLLSAPNLGLAGATTGWLEKPLSWPQIKTANVAFGQGISVSAMQLAYAYAVIANDGVMMRPTIIKEIRNKDGSLFKEWTPKVVRRVVSESTAEQITKALVSCVNEGTGKAAAVEGYTVGGKTGTAQKARADGRGYSGGGYVGSFIGFVPASNPKLLIIVVVDEPKGSHYGSVVAAPAFRNIAKKALWYLRTPRDAPQIRPGFKVAKKLTSA
ncbi:MAG: penicillin-binding protein 2 [Armatimonadota bacterium]|nr:penicillin-binding protein 2 [Armatimonadota bacterium]